MKHLVLPFLLFGLAACNDSDPVAVTAESEPNNTYSSADNIGLLELGGQISITAEVQANDIVESTDLKDHFLILPGYTGQVQVTVTPSDPATDVVVTEEASASSDGAVGNNAGAGAAEVLIIDITDGLSAHFRVETTLADTAYTLDVDPIAPATFGGPSLSVTDVTVDDSGAIEVDTTTILTLDN